MEQGNPQRVANSRLAAANTLAKRENEERDTMMRERGPPGYMDPPSTQNSGCTDAPIAANKDYILQGSMN
jgi:hypothetical protein